MVTTLKVELNRLPMILTYNQAIMILRNEVNTKFPTEQSKLEYAQKIKEVNAQRPGTSSNQKGKPPHKKGNNNSETITLTDGSSFTIYKKGQKISPAVWKKMSREQKIKYRVPGLGASYTSRTNTNNNNTNDSITYRRQTQSITINLPADADAQTIATRISEITNGTMVTTANNQTGVYSGRNRQARNRANQSRSKSPVNGNDDE